MKKVFFLLFFIALISVGEVSQVLPFKNDFQSLKSRIETLMNPDLREFTFSTYILKLDQGGMFFLALLKQAADRGVKIKGIVDSKIIGESPELLSFLKSNNIEIYYYNPIRFKNFSLFNPLVSIKKLNKRLHDKIWAAKFYESKTGKYRYLSLFGDKNISLDYYKQSRVFENNSHSMLGHELLIDNDSIGRQAFEYLQRLTEESEIYSSSNNSLPSSLTDRFNKKIQVYIKWLDTRFKMSTNLDFWESWKNLPVEVNTDKIQFLRDSSTETTYLQLLKELRNVNPGEEVYIENPYFILEPELIETLRILKEKSCHVTLVSNLPQVNNVWIAGKALEVDLQQIANLGVDVYLIDKKKDITHAKLAIIGNKRIYLGSSNFDPRSLVLNSESGLLIEDENLASTYKEKVIKKILNSTVVGIYNGQIFSQKNYLSYKFSVSSGNKALRCQSYYQRFDNYKASFLKQLFINLLRSYL